MAIAQAVGRENEDLQSRGTSLQQLAKAIVYAQRSVDVVTRLVCAVDSRPDDHCPEAGMRTRRHLTHRGVHALVVTNNRQRLRKG